MHGISIFFVQISWSMERFHIYLKSYKFIMRFKKKFMNTAPSFTNKIQPSFTYGEKGT